MSKASRYDLKLVSVEVFNVDLWYSYDDAIAAAGDLPAARAEIEKEIALFLSVDASRIEVRRCKHSHSAPPVV